MVKHAVAEIRNVAIAGHGAVGKTTLADLMLHKAGVAKRAGSVDDRSSLLDTDEEEHQHHFSISSHLCHFEHRGKRINIIDTPGYPDFIGQVIGALPAVETAAIAINAHSGIEVNTRRVFNKAGEAGVGRMILINKVDSDNVDVPALIETIRESFGQACVPLNLPVGTGANFKGVVSVLSPPDPLPADVQGDPKQWNQAAMDAIVEADEELMMRYLEGEQLSPDEVAGAISKAIAAGTLIPMFFTSAKSGAGVPEFMDALADYALSPLSLPRKAQNGKEEVPINPSPDAPLVAQVFKTRIDPFVAKISYLRIFSGKIAKDASVHAHHVSNGAAGTSKATKLHQLLDMQGASHEQVDQAIAGDIIAVAKVDDLHVGDTVTAGTEDLHLPPIPFPAPMIGLAVEPKSRNDQQKISGALQKIAEEDQTFAIERDGQTKEMVMKGMSELHLQIVQERLHHRDKVDVLTHKPKIPYRETVTGSHEGSYRHKKQSGGAGQFAEVHFKISPMPRDVNLEEYFADKVRFPNIREYHYDPKLNYAFVDRISGGSVPNNFIPAIEKGIKEKMEQGVVAGYQVQDIVVELFFGKDHPVDSNETAFKTAARMCLKEVFLKAKPAILEPIVYAEITVPDEKLGDITGELNSRRGRMEGMEVAAGGYQILKAKVPLVEMMSYAQSLTSRQCSFTMEMSHYEPVPAHEQQKIIAAAQHPEEEEA